MRLRGFEVCKGYEDKNINIPVRSTRHSAAYDLQAAEDVVIPSIWKVIFENAKKFLSGNTEYLDIKPTKVFTGLKSYFGEDEVLILANRSSGPAKMGLIMANSIGIVDSDYYNNPGNDGHLMYQYYNFFPTDVSIKKGERIGQAYFQRFLIADNDSAFGVRQGGIGSTGK